MAEFIYTMTKARKAHGDKVILDDVTMSFYPGAKIGVVGPNGAGKSTILHIMAGLDQPSNGEARLSPGYSVGILLQEPPLNEEKTVLGNVEEGLGQIKADVDRFNAISIEMAQPDADFETLMDEMGKLQEKIEAADAWDLDSQLEQAMDALRCPPPEADVSLLSGGERRRVALCKLLLSSRTCCCSTSPPTTSTPRACSGSSSTSRATTAPSSAVSTTGTSWTTSPSGSPRSTVAPLPLRGQLLDLPGEEVPSALTVQGKKTPSWPSGSRPSWSGSGPTRRRARPSPRPGWPATRRWRPRRTAPESWTSRRSRSRRVRASAAR
jgi:ABC-type lipoprotein export system ATPase subunit